MGLKQKVGSFVMGKAIDYISGNPETNLPKLLNWIDGLKIKGLDASSNSLHEIISDHDGVWYNYMLNLWRDIDNGILKSVFKNLILSSLVPSKKQEALSKKHGCNIPLALLIDPTSACNLKCTGCWAAEYGNNLNLSYDTLNDIVKQGKKLGTHFYVFTGGEPLVRKADLLRLCKAHQNCQFAAFTNGTLIDDEFVKKILKLKNFIPIISVEGFEAETDFRRGKGTFEKVKKAAALLKSHRIPFGFSSCYTSKNVDVIGSEEYFDQMIEWGAKFCWFFTYMPVGKKAVPELMATSEQRAYMYRQVRKFRRKKPLFTLDFWNDGEFSNGCIAGGRHYLHINANGDMEPCAFIHYSDSNIYKKTILEALQSPLFMAYHNRQPFNENHLRVCPLLDNPNALIDMVDTSNAYSTDLENPENVRELCAKCENAAANWAATADELWVCSGHCVSRTDNATNEAKECIENFENLYNNYQPNNSILFEKPKKPEDEHYAAGG
ncbi:MAG: radical SAM protein [Firmicutes bacterium]|nr:radical SAM protein [Bacillota bacterium]